MPKLKVKPTPAQGRVLQAFIDNPGERILYTGSNRATWMNYNTRKIWGKPRASTIRKMIADDWLMKFGDGRYECYYVLSESGRDIAEQLEPDDLISPPKLVTAETVISALRDYYPPSNWFVIDELAIGNYYSGERRADVLALKIRLPKVKGQKTGGGTYLEVRIFEVKVSKQDWKKEFENPRKRMRAMELANRFYFAAPEGLIKKSEVPEGCGLFEITKEGAKLTKQAKWSECEDPTWRLIAAIARRLS